MITILTPSKTMDFVSAAPEYVTPTQPVFLAQSQVLRRTLARYSSADIQQSMQVSQVIADRVVAMYRTEKRHKSAAWAYSGDVFKGLQVAALTAADMEYAQRRILIPSGLYGLLRPYDLIASYRLEMKAKIATERHDNLYAFWGSMLGEYVAAQPELQGELCVLSSDEYARAIVPHLSRDARIVTPAFIDVKKNGHEAQVPIYNKMMRGVMAQWLIRQRIDSLDRLKEFSAHGYHYDKLRSTADHPVFYRQTMRPLVLA